MSNHQNILLGFILSLLFLSMAFGDEGASSSKSQCHKKHREVLEKISLSLLFLSMAFGDEGASSSKSQCHKKTP